MPITKKSKKVVKLKECETKTLLMPANKDNGTMFKDHFLMMDITEFTSILNLVCERFLKSQRAVACLNSIYVFTGKVVLVIYHCVKGAIISIFSFETVCQLTNKQLKMLSLIEIKLNEKK